jgi:hypothetical protein
MGGIIQFQAGKYISQEYYFSFQPENINRVWQVNDLELLNLLSKADRYIRSLVRKIAVLK